MKTHELKTWPGPFAAVWHGYKPFEVRRDDRGFELGDRLWLREWNPETREYTGRELRGPVIRFILRGAEAEGFGLKPGYCVMAMTQPWAEDYVRPEPYDWSRDLDEERSFHIRLVDGTENVQL